MIVCTPSSVQHGTFRCAVLSMTNTPQKIPASCAHLKQLNSDENPPKTMLSADRFCPKGGSQAEFAHHTWSVVVIDTGLTTHWQTHINRIMESAFVKSQFWEVWAHKYTNSPESRDLHPNCKRWYVYHTISNFMLIRYALHEKMNQRDLPFCWPCGPWCNTCPFLRPCGLWCNLCPFLLTLWPLV